MATLENQALRGRDMICISHDWTGDPLSKTHLMRILARDNRILWINSIGYRTPSFTDKRDLSRIATKLRAATVPVREVEKNIFVLNPLAIPAWGIPGLASLNVYSLRWQIQHAMQRLKFRRPINWIFNPAGGILAGQLHEDCVIYYCVDEYTAFAGVNTTALAAIEQKLLNRADLVFASAEKLQKSKISPRCETMLIRHGVDYEHFRKAIAPTTQVPDDIQKLAHPRIGYFGLIARDWVDIPLLKTVARRFPHGSLIMIGKATMDLTELEAEPNVVFTGRKPYQELPAFAKGFDVAIIPFPISEVTLNANPLKAREYLAAGLPVVSTAIPEVKVLPECRTAATQEEFIEQLHLALQQPGPNPSRSEQMAIESWEARVQTLRQHFHAWESRR